MTDAKRIVAQFTQGSKPHAFVIYWDSSMTAKQLSTELSLWVDDDTAFEIMAEFLERAEESGIRRCRGPQ